MFLTTHTESPDAGTGEAQDDTCRLPCPKTESEPSQASKAADLNWGQCLEPSVAHTKGTEGEECPWQKAGARGAAKQPQHRDLTERRECGDRKPPLEVTDSS